jgi:hypothetical protein
MHYETRTQEFSPLRVVKPSETDERCVGFAIVPISTLAVGVQSSLADEILFIDDLGPCTHPFL